jgi:hypothetical protein
MQTRAEYVQWCKDRALEYVKAGDLQNALASMMSDMSKREDTNPASVLFMLGAMEINNGPEAMRRFIEGFN